MTRVALTLAAVLAFSLCNGVARADDQPQVSKGTAKILKAAQEALAVKNYNEVLAKTREAAAVTGRNAYDDFVIHELQMAVYAAQSNYTETGAAIEAIIDSPYLQAAQKPQLLRTLMSIEYQNKDYDKAILYGERARHAGDNSSDTELTVAQAYFLNGKYKEALEGMQSIVERDEQAGHKPAEKALSLIWTCALKVKDEAAASRAVEKLIVNYPKPDYWANAMVGVLPNRSSNVDDRLLLMTYRLMAQVGVLKKGDQYTEMAQIALDQGNPGEAQTMLEQALGKNLYTDAHEKERSQRLLEKVRKVANDDRSAMARDEKDAAAAPTGDAYVQVGAAYLGFGEPEKAVTAITTGIAKGKLKYPDESYLLLGMAYERTKNKAEAVKAFGRATSDPKYARLAKLWVLEARS
ncbi:MAG TPA: tetratricopeptide repeat protein [Steroidobacteraceae bacterium]|nr:tetratricopeptide repeat protein [Steroidobacteraceae bacterium]